jgi:hypothetical protein
MKRRIVSKQGVRLGQNEERPVTNAKEVVVGTSVTLSATASLKKS